MQVCSNRLKVVKNSAVVISENEECYYSDCGDFSVELFKNELNSKIMNLKCAAGEIKLEAVKQMYERLRVCYYEREMRGSDCVVRYDYGNGTELLYSVYSDRVKSDLVINRRQDRYEYLFLLDAKDFSAESCKNGGIIIKNIQSGENVYYIPAPFMRDAAGVVCREIYFEQFIERDNLVLKVVADYSFIDEFKRRFPVTVDIQFIKWNAGCGIQCETIEHDVDMGNALTVRHPHILYAIFDGYGRTCEAQITFPVLKNSPEMEISSAAIELACAGGSGKINIGGQSFTLQDGDCKDKPRIFRVDVSDCECGVLNVTAEEEGAYAEFYTYGEYAPKLVVEYLPQTESEEKKMVETNFAQTDST